MADIKTLQTRIALKYDTYANWTNEDVAGQGANLVLLPGEIGICAFEEKRASDPAVQTSVPTVLFKVGDGKHTFSELKWASALAADVYDWAKAATVEFENTEAVAADGTFTKGTQKILFKDAAGNSIGGATLDLSAFATEAEVANITDALDKRLVAVEELAGVGGTSTGTSLTERMDAAEGSLKQILGDPTATEDAAKAGLISTTAASTLSSAKAYTDTLRTDLTKENGLIDVAVKEATDYADGLITDLVSDDGQVGANTKAIAGLAEQIAQESKDREAGDEGIGKRLQKLEVFFEGADHDGEDGTQNSLHDALDTLVEIQDYLNKDGEGVKELISDVSDLKTALGSDRTVSGDTTTAGTGLIEDVRQAEDDIDALEQDVAALNETLNTKSTGIVDRVEALETTVGDATKGLVKGLADVTDAVGDDNNGLTKDVNTLIETVGNADAGLVHDLAALRGEFNEADAVLGRDAVGDGTASGLVADVREAEKAITEIQGDYLKMADLFIIDCGSSTVVTHSGVVTNTPKN